MTLFTVGGLLFAAVGALGAVYCLMARETPSKWPHSPIKLSDSPGAFWARVRLYGTIAAIGLAVSAFGAVASLAR